MLIDKGIQDYADRRMLEALSHHQCTGCGSCCRWPSQVFLYADDIKRIALELEMAEATFLIRSCVVVHWKWQDCEQFRIALARREFGNECVFLTGTLCGIHQFKPLMCKAGPAAWGWIRDSKSFWFFVRESPSFHHSTLGLSKAEANHWFTATREAEARASLAKSIRELAEICEVSEEILHGLNKVEFTEEVTNVRGTSTTSTNCAK